MADGLQKRLENEYEKFSLIQKDIQKAMNAKKQLESQLTENSMVKEEFEKRCDDGVIYKLVGPVLIKQDPEESMQIVLKRIDYINGEIKRNDTLINDSHKKGEAHRETLTKLQQQLQQMQVKAAMK